MIASAINFKWFLISLALGLFLAYCTASKPEVIVKYPTPDNSNNLIFEDDVNNCYKFNVDEVTCPKDKSKTSNIPIQRSIEYFDQKKNNS